MCSTSKIGKATVAYFHVRTKIRVKFLRRRQPFMHWIIKLSIDKHALDIPDKHLQLGSGADQII